ncbi:DUF3631 domain-containing protein [Streptomyces sp. 35G-GA-8]|uniref:DUF3631 domain-containing protein n=1 Tax=Streptomyces sp. 35G-GA-8 TaxID=2939434 RepID=UPI00201EFA5B|nr:DUF3631 domain-containing protein [Streptomyces sp. 35G-GA-8]MCL7381249.1 DUF3631 domain-containing protein [Streptomyces sp. 35G-GA-8]
MTEAQPQTPSHRDVTPPWRPVAVPGQGAKSTVPPTDEDRDDEPPATPPLEGAQVLADLQAQITRYVILPSAEALTAVTLWVAATHLQPAWQHAPRLAVVAPEKRCGKSRLLDVLTETVHNCLITVNASPAAIFRSITDDNPPTLLVDEADTLFGTAKAAERNEDLRGLLNAGHQRNRPTLRVSGPEHKPTPFPTFAMAALAGIDDLPDTIMDRSVVIRMRRRAPGEKVAAFRTHRDTPALHALRDRLASWLQPLGALAADREPVMPVEDRAADTWEPLVIVADLAGGDWPALVRTACRIMSDYEAGQDEEGGLRTRLLVGIRRAFGAERDPAVLATKRLLEALNADREAPWAEYGAGGLTPRGLQLLLKPYGISSANRRFPDGTQAKGFARNQFLDAWARYCPEPAPAAGSTVATAELLPGTAP